MQTDDVQFGNHPRSWLISGLFCCMAGAFFLLVGASFAWVLWNKEAVRHTGAIFLTVVFCLCGFLAVTTGLWIVARREQLKIVLSGQVVRVGTLRGFDDIPYADIEQVVEGVDCVLFRLRNGKRYTVSDWYFHSSEERKLFLCELSQRISSRATTA